MSLSHIKLNGEIKMQEGNGKVVLFPVAQEYCLEDRVNEITSENRHDEISFGRPVGAEVF